MTAKIRHNNQAGSSSVPIRSNHRDIYWDKLTVCSVEFTQLTGNRCHINLCHLIWRVHNGIMTFLACILSAECITLDWCQWAAPSADSQLIPWNELIHSIRHGMKLLFVVIVIGHHQCQNHSTKLLFSHAHLSVTNRIRVRLAGQPIITLMRLLFKTDVWILDWIWQRNFTFTRTHARRREKICREKLYHWNSIICSTWCVVLTLSLNFAVATAIVMCIANVLTENDYKARW